ncbi:amino acid ABC transporter permease [Afifella marina]|uniref:General L-amino acid transport system permease protein n=1 Tax=Afifella marina DSM 2698 TaxID=1120955 RepID=A0A1G5P6R1_AFIMA|nr:amino acid ABC transporter permease [Afifella marina]MBK1624855.1 amino acid ABC transporter permease [Afifella marina DSM 2698]MBK1628449.1 amino acid ABC transporter permease [Afifella marina]MBK5917936.1 amino acid ABC transporter permease [Afifella marina]RAI18725.1 amino acid ABC transporter permease [Afifella marina DSM 2698]SCZ45247.1 general L-amino acid transport system permease protein [Afifella marina DSM 2698]
MSDIQSETDLVYVRDEMLSQSPPPHRESGPVGWLRKNLFSSLSNTVLTLIALYVIWIVVPPLIDFALVQAVWSGDSRDVCTTINQGGIQPNGWFGACWPYVKDYFAQFIYGRYPVEERWRVNIVFVLFVIGVVPLLVPTAPFKSINLIYMAVVFPVAALLLLTGGHMEFESMIGIGRELAPLGSGLDFWIEYALLTLVVLGIAYAWARGTGAPAGGLLKLVLTMMLALAAVIFVLSLDLGLEFVPTSIWGGLLVTLVIAITGIAASLPLGVVLALGRRSDMPIVRFACVVFIEFWRGVPLITVLFMSSVMLPLFLPEGVSFDKLLRALIGVALFSAAYMAEVIRGGLQAIPKGQYEGADAVGLAYWQKMRLIILPQALTLVIPGIVNTFIGLFKDTTLVLIIGLFDFLGQIQSSFTDPSWSTPVQATTAYFFAACVYWIFCFSMSRYSIFTENRLRTGHAR